MQRGTSLLKPARSLWLTQASSFCSSTGVYLEISTLFFAMSQRFVSRPSILAHSARTFSLRRLTTVPGNLALTQTLDKKTRHLASNLSHESVRVLAISAKLRIRLLTAFEGLSSPYTHLDLHCNASRTAISAHLPPRLIMDILDFRSNRHAPGALLITGLPLDPFLPLTPMNGERSTQKQSFVSEGCLTGIATLLGEPLSFASEKNGELIHNICPVQHREAAQSNESSKVDLRLHVENAYFDDRPDYLALYCLRQDHKKEALTSFVDAGSALSQLDLTERAELQKPVFVVPSPSSHHETMGGEKWSSSRPLFENPENPRLICHFPGMKALDPKAQKALDKFEETTQHSDVVRHIALQPGSILLLNNHKVAHGRTYFEPRYDGFDRWLQRLYIRSHERHETSQTPLTRPPNSAATSCTLDLLQQL
jgi:L-asparagine oxygenase